MGPCQSLASDMITRITKHLYTTNVLLIIRSENMNAKQILEILKNADYTTENDEKIMQIILNKIGFKNAVVTCGIVYLEGRGTMDAPPTSIQHMAEMLLRTP